MPAATARRWIIVYTFLLREREPCCQLAMPKRGEEGSSGFRGQLGPIEPLIQKLFEIVVAGKLVDLAAFFMEPDPAAAFLNVVVLDLHRQNGADAGEV